MKRKWTWILTGVALVALAVVASAAGQTPAPAVAQEQEAQAGQQAQQKLAAKLAEAQARLVRKMVELQQNAEVREKLAAEMAYQHAVALAGAQEARAEEMARRHATMYAQAEKLSQLQRLGDDPAILLEDGENGWLGVSITEVTAEKVKELKLPAERGVVVTEVESESAAAKAGIKAGDVIIEFAGQRIEGTVQFRRVVRETLAGRTVPVTVWRDARAQNLSVVTGSRRDFIRDSITVYTPKDFSFELPNKFDLFSLRTPTLGINGEDLSGQLGQYFGAPDGEGVLIKHVNSGSPAEKAGMKAGDVITKIDGERIRTIEDLRSKMGDKREQKSVNVTVLRKGTETSLKVEIEQPETKRDVRRTVSRRISM